MKIINFIKEEWVIIFYAIAMIILILILQLALETNKIIDNQEEEINHLRTELDICNLGGIE